MNYCPALCFVRPTAWLDNVVMCCSNNVGRETIIKVCSEDSAMYGASQEVGPHCCTDCTAVWGQYGASQEAEEAGSRLARLEETQQVLWLHWT